MMETTLYNPDSRSLEAAAEAWNKATQRLDHLRVRKVRNASQWVHREYLLALAEVERARLAASVVGQNGING